VTRTSGSTPFLASLVLLAATAAVAGLRYGPPAVPGAEADAHSFSASRASATLQRLVGDGIPHPAGTPAAAKVRARIVEQLERTGYSPHVREGFGCSSYGACADVANVVARLPGREAGPAVLLASHYDSQPAGPGASDDGVGTVVLLEVARALRTGPTLRHDVIFLFDEGEEYGLLGAEAFVASDPWADDVAVVVNIEARGTRGPSVMFETSRGNRRLIEIYAEAVAHPRANSAFSTIYERLPNDTDLSVFKQYEYAGLNFAHAGNFEHYHTPLDDVRHTDRATIQHHGDNLLAVTRALAETDLPLAETSDAVFFDVFGLRLVRWPAHITLPAALLAFALLALWLVAAAREGALTGRDLLVGLAAWPAAVAGSALGGLALVALLQWSRGVLTPWTAHPAPTRVAVWALASVGVLLAAHLRPTRGRALGLLAGAGIWWACIATAFAATLPGLSFPFLVPLVTMTLATCATRLVRRVTDDVVVILGSGSLVLATGILWFPIALSLEDAFGFRGGAIIAACVALAGSGTMPLLPRVHVRLRRTLFGIATGTVLVAGGAALRLPPYSADHPRHLSVMFHQDVDQNSADWLLSAQDGAPPDALRAVAPFEPWQDAKLPLLAGWFTQRAYRARAEPTPQPGPELTILEETSTTEGRRVRVRLRSNRGAGVVEVWVPPEVEPIAAILKGTPYPLQSEKIMRFTKGWRRYAYMTAPAVGYEMEFLLREPEPVSVYVIDQTYDLPDTASALLEARPEWAVPVSAGDSWVMIRRARL
jgi:hypothetical protein